MVFFSCACFGDLEDRASVEGSNGGYRYVDRSSTKFPFCFAKLFFFPCPHFLFFWTFLFSFLLERAEARVSRLLLSFFLLIFCLVCFFFFLFFCKRAVFSSLQIVLLHLVACYALRCLFLGARKRVLSTRRVLLGSFNKIFVPGVVFRGLRLFGHLFRALSALAAGSESERERAAEQRHDDVA